MGEGEIMEKNYKRFPSGYGMVQKKAMQLKMSVGAKALYALLASYTGSDEYCFPHQNTLARDLQISRRSVIRYIQELEKNDLLLNRKHFPKSYNQGNEYVLLLIE